MVVRFKFGGQRHVSITATAQDRAIVTTVIAESSMGAIQAITMLTVLAIATTLLVLILAVLFFLMFFFPSTATPIEGP